MMFVAVAVAVLAITCGGCLVALVVLWRKVSHLFAYTKQLEEGIARASGEFVDDGHVQRRPQLRLVRGGGRYLAGIPVVGWLRDHPAAVSSAAGVVATAAVVGPFMLTPDVGPPGSMPERVPESAATAAPPTGRLPAPRVTPSPAPTVDTGGRSNRREARPASDGDEAEPSPPAATVDVEVTATTPPPPAPGDDEVVPPVQVPRQPPDDSDDAGCVARLERLACVDLAVELDAA